MDVKKCEMPPGAPIRFNFLGFSGAVEENTLTFLKSFCYFWALDMAPTWAGPGLL